MAFLKNYFLLDLLANIRLFDEIVWKRKISFIKLFHFKLKNNSLLNSVFFQQQLNIFLDLSKNYFIILCKILI
jgi:hypothetical protein